MSAQTFVLLVACASALLAVWLYVRFERRAPGDLVRGIVHLTVAFGAMWLGVPALRLAIANGIDPGLALVGIVLPALTYVLLATLWMLRLVQQMLPGIGRR